MSAGSGFNGSGTQATITIKAQSVTLDFKASDGNYQQHRTPQATLTSLMKFHVLLAACEGALLVVDAGQGVEAQTLANCYTALEMDLEVVPVLAKSTCRP